MHLLPIDKLINSEKNPNTMSGERLEQLQASIAKKGFLQPILVRNIYDVQDGLASPSVWEIIDGHHRVKVVRQLNEQKPSFWHVLESLPAITIDCDDAQAMALRISLNRLRGEINLSSAAEIISDLAKMGWGSDELFAIGFNDEEVSSLLGSMVDTSANILDDASAMSHGEDENVVERPFSLELTFRSKDELDAAKKVLRKAAGKGGDIADGFLRLIGVLD